jgi:catechol 2,3-dioxygenase-like lactoylglutathione lyase family enzyme
MSNPQKAKGTRWETAVTDFLREVLGRHRVYKPRQEGFRDVGDIHAPPFIIQAKDWRDVVGALREGLDGAEIQAGHAGLPFGAAVVKRVRKPVGKAYFVLTLEDAAALMKRLAEAEGRSEQI